MQDRAAKDREKKTKKTGKARATYSIRKQHLYQDTQVLCGTPYLKENRQGAEMDYALQAIWLVAGESVETSASQVSQSTGGRDTGRLGDWQTGDWRRRKGWIVD